MKVTISVVMPVYNMCEYLRSSVESILGQTFHDFELIVVDDGSTDNSVHVIKEFKDPRIRLICTGINRGNYYARNIGLKLARGRYICVMDADDIAYPQRLDFQFRYLQKKTHIGLIGSQGHVINEQGSKVKLIERPVSVRIIKLMLLKHSCFIHSSLMLRTEFIKKFYLHYNAQWRYAADYDFINACTIRFPVGNLDEPLIGYRRHSEQISTKSASLQAKYANIVRLKQLNGFRLTVTSHEKNLYLKIFNGELQTDKEVSNATDLCNKLLKRNKLLQLYNTDDLNKFFCSQINSSLKYNLKPAAN